jgi:hypothetical protein
MRARIFLRQPLFVPAGHAPRSAVILEGTVADAAGMGWRVDVERWFAENGQALEGEACTLIVPSAKIDHALVIG